MRILLFIAIFSSASAQAQINDAFRSQNAVVLYRFLETTGDVVDSANAKFGAPANLQIVYPAGVRRSPGVLEITNANLIRSYQPVTKIYDTCSPKGEMSLEMDIENNENVEKRSGLDTKKVNQPLRIISYSKGLFNRNFLFGQFYDMGNLYVGAINNSSVEPMSETDPTLGNSLVDPVMSDVPATLVPGDDGKTKAQKIIMTFKKGVANLYLSDADGRMYLHKANVSQGFSGDMSTWRRGAYLTLGNEYISDSNLSVMGQGTLFASCNPKTDATCGTNPNRYWKGKIRLVAVYCQALTSTQIFGAGSFQVVENPVFPIDINLQITPTLKKSQEIFQRLTGSNSPITNPLFVEMEKKLLANDPIGAAALATESPNFYNITVRDFAARMSNRDETINVPLNDFTATVVGAVRDNVSAQRLLTDNFVYVADPTKASVPSNMVTDLLRSNNHYEALGAGRFDLSKVLVPMKQKLFNGTVAVDNPTPSGLLTTRQWMAAHAIAGTNRRPVEFSLREFLCTPLEKAADASGPDNVVGPDIDRFPGGSHAKYTTSCRACHTIMDGFRPAFANYTFSNNFVKHAFVVPSLPIDGNEDNSVGMIQKPQYVAKKINHNEHVFPGGRIVENDSWVNNANSGINKEQFGWNATSGQGIASFGKLIAESKQFPRCMAERVFKSVCKRDPASSDEAMLKQAATEFSSERGYNLKYLFQRIVTTKECLGGQ